MGFHLLQFKFHEEATKHHIPEDWNLRNEKPFNRITSCIKDFLKVYICAPVHSTYSYATLEGSGRGEKKQAAALAKQNRRLSPFLYHLSLYTKERRKCCV